MEGIARNSKHLLGKWRSRETIFFGSSGKQTKRCGVDEPVGSNGTSYPMLKLFQACEKICHCHCHWYLLHIAQDLRTLMVGWMYIFTIIGITVNTPDLINRYVFLSQRLMVPYKLLFYMRMENYYLFPFTLKTYSKMFLLCNRVLDG